jgi:hypothetical protein
MRKEQQWTWQVIDFANEPKEYEWWIDVEPIERLREARKLREFVYVLQQRTRREFQPVVAVIER